MTQKQLRSVPLFAFALLLWTTMGGTSMRGNLDGLNFGNFKRTQPGEGNCNFNTTIQTTGNSDEINCALECVSTSTCMSFSIGTRSLTCVLLASPNLTSVEPPTEFADSVCYLIIF